MTCHSIFQCIFLELVPVVKRAKSIFFQDLKKFGAILKETAILLETVIILEDLRQEHHDMFEGKQVIAMELGGMSLKKYFYYKSKETNKERENLQDVIIKLLKGAALAVEEFHKHAIHLDIKDDNFVLSREQKNENIIYSKLIDFNISVLKSDINSAPVRSAAEIYKAPEIRNNDTSKGSFI
uniref:Protein kinase domain-containing protein n=1 Tax=Meloidogyne hapla TaxID=6305 RepID=A0A1I8B4E1_MELHA